MPGITSFPQSNPRALAEAGEKIYRDKYQQKYEAQHFGKFVAIDIQTQQAYLGDTPEDAYAAAKRSFAVDAGGARLRSLLLVDVCASSLVQPLRPAN